MRKFLVLFCDAFGWVFHVILWSELLDIKMAVAMVNPNLRYVEWWFSIGFCGHTTFSHRDKVNANEKLTLAISCNSYEIYLNRKCFYSLLLHRFPFVYANFIYGMCFVCGLLHNKSPSFLLCVYMSFGFIVYFAYFARWNPMSRCNWPAAFFCISSKYFFVLLLTYRCSDTRA